VRHAKLALVAPDSPRAARLAVFPLAGASPQFFCSLTVWHALYALMWIASPTC
jgi:surfactin synthase thioesterase subunit